MEIGIERDELRPTGNCREQKLAVGAAKSGRIRLFDAGRPTGNERDCRRR